MYLKKKKPKGQNSCQPCLKKTTQTLTRFENQSTRQTRKLKTYRHSHTSTDMWNKKGSEISIQNVTAGTGDKFSTLQHTNTINSYQDIISRLPERDYTNSESFAFLK